MENYLSDNKKDYLYCLIIGLLAFIYGMENIYVFSSNTDALEILDFIEWPLYLVVLYLVLSKRLYKLKELIFILLILIVTAIIYYNSGFAVFVKSVFLVVAAKNISFQRICKAVRNAYILNILFTIFLFITGISNAGTLRRGYLAYGYSSVNVFGGYIFIICLLNLILDKEINIRKIIGYWIVAFCVYFFLNDRTAVCLIFIMPLLKLVIEKIIGCDKLKFFWIVLCMVPIICLAISIITVKLYRTNVLIQQLDILLNYRITLNYRNFHEWGTTLLGQKATFESKKGIYNTVDNSYMCLIIQMGIVATALYMIVDMINIKKAFVIKNAAVITSILLLSVYALTESSVIDVLFYVPMLYLVAKDSNNNEELNKLT